MDNDEIKQELIAEARAKGICADGYATMLGMGSTDGLVGYYLTHPDWCMERSFPSYAFLKAHFAEIGDMGVFVGRTFYGEVLNERQVYVFHRCRGTIKVGLNTGKSIIPMLYLANRCRMHIVGVGDVKPKKESERSIVPIYTFGHNDVSAKENRYVKFTHHQSELI